MILATTKERLLQFLEYKGVDRSTFYEKTGIKRGLLDSDKLDGALADHYIAKIIASFDDINIYWLITGEGEMTKKKEQNSALSQNESLKFLLSRIEELVVENNDLRRQNEELTDKKKYDQTYSLPIASEPECTLTRKNKP